MFKYGIVIGDKKKPLVTNNILIIIYNILDIK